MATEQQYDELIAPKLAKVAELCQQMGMSLIARVEWEPGEAGITQIGDLTSAGQNLTRYAAHSRGNIDAMCLALKRDCDVSQSLFLRQFST